MGEERKKRPAWAPFRFQTALTSLDSAILRAGGRGPGTVLGVCLLGFDGEIENHSCGMFFLRALD